MKFRICLLLIITLFIPCAEAEESFKNIADSVSPSITMAAGKAGGEWAVLALARRGEWNGEEYIKSLSEYLEQNNGILSDNKYTEYSRTVLALSSLGKDAEDFAGYNLVEPLLDYDKVTFQGINGSVFALLALDSVSMDKNKEIRSRYLSNILESQLEDGGFAMSGEEAEADITAMAAAAIAKYEENDDVRRAVDRAVSCLSEIQTEDGSYESWGESTAESTAQVLFALCEADIDLKDDRFIKNSNSVLDALMGFYSEDGFCHIKGGDVNEMATQQSFFAIVAYERIMSGKSPIFDMRDVEKKIYENNEKAAGYKKITFSDINENTYRNEIELLAGMGIISGMSEKEFAPDLNITRAQFAALIVNAAGFEKRREAAFADVSSDSWYAPYVGAAWKKGIISGISETEFAPDLNITKEQAAAIIARCAETMEIDISMTESAARDILAQFPDYRECSKWAENALAFCYNNGILPFEDFEISPQKFARRDEIAGMIYGLLKLEGTI